MKKIISLFLLVIILTSLVSCQSGTVTDFSRGELDLTIEYSDSEICEQVRVTMSAGSYADRRIRIAFGEDSALSGVCLVKEGNEYRIEYPGQEETLLLPAGEGAPAFAAARVLCMEGLTLRKAENENGVRTLTFEAEGGRYYVTLKEGSDIPAQIIKDTNDGYLCVKILEIHP